MGGSRFLLQICSSAAGAAGATKQQRRWQHCLSVADILWDQLKLSPGQYVPTVAELESPEHRAPTFANRPAEQRGKFGRIPAAVAVMRSNIHAEHDP